MCFFYSYLLDIKSNVTKVSNNLIFILNFNVFYLQEEPILKRLRAITRFM